MKKRLALATIVALCCTAGGFAIFGSGRIATVDFRAFYCAGMLTRIHSDPYRAQPLHDCEVGQTDRNFAFYDRSITLPAPQPPYDFALFAAFSAAPFHLAKQCWGALLALAVAGTCAALIRLTALPPAVVLCAMLPTFIGPSLALGQIIPLYAVAASGAILFVAERRYELAAIAAAVSLVEPHLGLPICVSLFLWAPRTRLVLGLTAAALAALSLAFGGTAENVEYFSHVLPLHALSELPADGQLSFTALLHGLGTSDKIALIGGSISYFVVSAIAIAAARAGALRLGNDALLAALPAAGAVLGGTFVHGTDIVAAIPLALLVVTHAQSQKTPLTIAFALLLTYWGAALEPTTGLVPWFALCALSAGYVIYYFTQNSALAVGGTVLAFAALFEVSHVYGEAVRAYAHLPHRVSTAIDPAYSEATWAKAIRERSSTGAACVWLVRALTWTGLITVLTAAIRRPEPASISRQSARGS